jgi:hypothetical protein
VPRGGVEPATHGGVAHPRERAWPAAVDGTLWRDQRRHRVLGRQSEMKDGSVAQVRLLRMVGSDEGEVSAAVVHHTVASEEGQLPHPWRMMSP